MDAPNEMPSLLRYFWLGLYVVFIVCVFVCLKFVGLIVLLLLLLCRASVFAWRFLVGAAPSSRLVGWIRTPSWRDSTEIGARLVLFLPH